MRISSLNKLPRRRVVDLLIFDGLGKPEVLQLVLGLLNYGTVKYRSGERSVSSPRL